MKSIKLNIFGMLAIIAALLMPAPAVMAAPAAAAQDKGLSPAELLNPDGTLKLDGRFSGSLNLSGWNVHIDAVRGPVFDPAEQAGSSAANPPQPGQWSSLSGSQQTFEEAVYAIAVSGTDVYVGGNFRDAGDIPEADYVVKWDGAHWSALGGNGARNGSIGSYVNAIAVSGSDVYVGGTFSDVNNNGAPLPTADFIARWDGSSWHALGSNGLGDGALNSTVQTVAISGSYVYVGGWFDNAGGNGLADYIARWNTANSTWSALGSNGSLDGSLNGAVQTIVVYDPSHIYVGGHFTNVNNNGAQLNAADYLAKWDGSSWSNLGNNGAIIPDGSLNAVVYALALDDAGNLYAGGNFTDVKYKSPTLGVTLFSADYVAKYNVSNASWSALGSNGANNGSLNATVYALAVNGSHVYVGGSFTNVQNPGGVLTSADYIADWDGSSWSPLGGDGSGQGSLNLDARTIAVTGGRILVGGQFSKLNNYGTLITASYFTAWDGSGWLIYPPNNLKGSLDFTVHAMAISGGDVYIGGSFDDIGDGGVYLPEADNIAKWDGTHWSALGSDGNREGALNNTVYGIAVSGTDVYVGGTFTDVNNNGTLLPEADYIARWDGSNWHALGNNGAGDGALDSQVNAIAVIGANVFVGGNFSNAAGYPSADYIARWNGSSWSPLSGNGVADGSLNERVTALAVSANNLYVGGMFKDVNNGGVKLDAADYIARWDSVNEQWSALGSNGAGNGALNKTVGALAVSGSDLYVGGWFTDVNNNGTPLLAADYITRWDGTNWYALGHDAAGNGALNDGVDAIAVAGKDIYIGGSFWKVYDNATLLPGSYYIAKWDGTHWQSLSNDGAGGYSLGYPVFVLAVNGTNLYAGGFFSDVNNFGRVLTAADYIAAYNISRGKYLPLVAR